jgi:hypothetical protein
MIVPDNDLSIRCRSGRENAVHTSRSQRKRPLAQNVNFLLERTKHMRLMKMIRGRDYDCIELIRVEELVNVSEDVRNAKALCKCTSLGAVVVADGDELRAANARENRQVRELRYRSCSNQSKSDVRAQIRPTVVP